jgi:putative transposase
MTELFKNKYRISSARLQTWNYADNGMYFITICTANRECFFGNVVDARCIAALPDAPQQTHDPVYKMELNDLGKVVEMEWLKTKELRPDMNLELGEYVVMPNHFHGIIFIDDNQYNLKEYSNDRDGDAMHCSTTFNNVNDYSNGNQKNKFGPQAKNLASIIRGFKSAVTTYARKNNTPFDWQGRFHDHIITTNKEYLRIAHYIINNPQNWSEDRFYVK